MKTAINYTTSGEGQAFVFQHGLGANISQVQSLLGAFSGIQLISSDSKGHGESPFDPQSPPSFERYSEDVIKVLDDLGIEKALFGGISMGSGISVNIALRYPERVEGLVLVRPAWLDYGSPDNLKILLDIAEVIDQADGKEKFEKSAVFQKIQHELPNAAKSIMGQFSRDQGSFTSQVLNCMVKDQPFSSLEELKAIEKPCLVIGNEDDPLHPWKMAQTIHEHIPNSILKKVTSRYKDNALHKSEVLEVLSTFILSNN